MEVLIAALAELIVLFVVAAVELIAAIALPFLEFLAEVLFVLLTKGLSALGQKWREKQAKKSQATTSGSASLPTRPAEVPAAGLPAPSLSVSSSEATPPAELQPAKLPSHFVLSPISRRRLRIGTAAVAVFLIVSLLVVDLFCIGPAIRFGLRNLEANSGIQFQFGRASGHMLLGQIELHNVQVRRQKHANSNFDLKCPRVEVQLSLWNVLWSKQAFERVAIDRLNGDYERLTLAEPQPTRRDFVIGVLEIRESQLKFVDRTVDGDPVRLDLAVRKLECQPLRSRFAIVDLLLRSHIAGTINDAPFAVTCQTSGDLRETEWDFAKLPVSIVGAYFGGPFRWLTDGTVGLRVTNQCRPGAEPKEHLQCRFLLEDIRAAVPNDVHPRMRKVAELATRYFNDHRRRMEFGFELDLDLKGRRLDATSTDDLKQLWNTVREAAIEAFFEACSEKIEGLKDAMSDKLQGLLKKTKEAIKESIDRDN